MTRTPKHKSLGTIAPNQPLPEPWHKLVVADLSLSDTRYDFHYGHIFLNEFVAATLHHQLDQVKCCSLVSIGKTVVCHYSVQQCSCFLIYAPMVAVVGAGDRGKNRVLADDSRCAAVL